MLQAGNGSPSVPFIAAAWTKWQEAEHIRTRPI
jgi:hypothetical protein